ncbi:MAG: hypothetical protein QOC82_1454 [Frankiaceae bacterium]|jgi:hypothetical protein|nr:hypothetical protein [Frankiaceae bacterium]MDQ1700286.1 hypothetical protein [Frankiaceae bacterium]
MADERLPADAVVEIDEGEDVAATTRDPDAIQKEIEQTRAELAETIDAIADRISPKRAASRGAQAVKSQVSSVFGGEGAKAPAAVIDAPPRAAGSPDPATRTAAVREIAASGGGAAHTGTREFTVARRLRTDRVLLLVGALGALGGLVVLRRSRS